MPDAQLAATERLFLCPKEPDMAKHVATETPSERMDRLIAELSGPERKS